MNEDLDPDDAQQAARQAVLAVLEPLAALLMSRQLVYGEAEGLLKAAFVQAATKNFMAHGQQPSASNLSVATGIHRREVTRLMDEPLPGSPRKVPAASQARLLWITHTDYLDGHGQPRRLPRQAPAGEPSFTQLAARVSKDVHAKALLDELLRTGAVESDGDHVVLRHKLFSPPPEQAAALHVAGANLGDHIGAVAHNLGGAEPRWPERALYADGLTEASARRAAEFARELWAKSLPEMRHKLQALVDLDADATDRHWRVRIGLYGYAAEVEPSDSPQPPARKPRGRPPRLPRRPAIKP